MIETELLTFPLEGKDKFIAEMKTFNVLHKLTGKVMCNQPDKPTNSAQHRVSKGRRVFPVSLHAVRCHQFDLLSILGSITYLFMSLTILLTC